MNGIRIKLDTSTIKKIALFESITKAKLKDCIDYEDEILFIVGQGSFGKAIGRGGANAKLLQRKFKKRVVFLEFNKDPAKFASNILRPIQVRDKEVIEETSGSQRMNIHIKSSQRAFPSKKVKKTKFLVKKYFPNIEEVMIRV
jgi:N utilization substance protein A